MCNLLIADIARSQVVSDRTTATNLRACGTSCIEVGGGTQGGRNLFHSFLEFSPRRTTVRFINNNPDIQNVIGRVTGSSASRINGMLEAGGESPQFNLFLLNPNGVVFGSNARLNIAGSFVVTTSSAIKFGNQGSFSTIDTTQNPLLLTVHPSALLFNQAAPQPIIYRATASSPDQSALEEQLQVPNGESLLLVGGRIELDDSRLVAPAGQIELAAIAAPGMIRFAANRSRLQLTVPNQTVLGDTTLTNRAQIRAIEGGNINIFSRDIRLNNRSRILAYDGGSLGLFGRQVTLTNGSQISTSTFGGEAGGDLTIVAAETVLLRGLFEDEEGRGTATGIFAQAESGSTGAGGDISIITRQLIVQGGAQVTVSTFTEGKSGTLTIDASGVVLVRGISNPVLNLLGEPIRLRSGLFATARRAPGAGGDLSITANRLVIQDGALISAETSGSGQGGRLSVNAAQAVEISGTSTNGTVSELSTRSLRIGDVGVVGDAGDVNIQTGQLIMQDGGNITAATASGNGGNISLRIRDQLLLRQGSSISTTAGTEQSGGDGGDISIQANFIAAPAAANSDITANAFTGTGGNISITAQGILGIQSRSHQTELSDITASSTFGRSGTIEIDAAEGDPKRALISLPTEFFSARLDRRCQMGSGGASSFSRFVYTGQGGLSPSPQEADVGDLWQDWRLPTA
ncbi:filamentous hemagglutinin N-terminal domain-containing protein, partial [Phormidium tenue FACHB-886]|nr:filamentous hemagglutinin N-terminal domain-containing protein [Phormidium tenue FACHB-886]